MVAINRQNPTEIKHHDMKMYWQVEV